MSFENLRRRKVFFWWFEGDGDSLPAEQIYFIPTEDLGYTDENFIAQRKVYAISEGGGKYYAMLWCDEDSNVAIDWKVQFPADPSDPNAAAPKSKSFSLAYGPGTPIALGTPIKLGIPVPNENALFYQAVYLYILSLIADGVIAAGSGPDLIAPTTPASISASNITNTSARANWSPSTDNVEVIGYRVQLAALLDTTFENPLVDQTVGVQLYYDFTGLPASDVGVVYWQRVEALDEVGNPSGWRTGQFTTAAPSGGSGGDGEYIVPAMTPGAYVVHKDSLGVPVIIANPEINGSDIKALNATGLPYTFTNKSLPGACFDSVAGGFYSLLASRAAAVNPYFQTGKRNITDLATAWNDNNRIKTVGQYLRELFQYSAEAHADGWLLIDAVAPPAHSETTRENYMTIWLPRVNAFKKAHWARFCDAFVDTTLDPNIGTFAPTNSAFFGDDQLHKSIFGYAAEYPYIETEIDALSIDVEPPAVPEDLTVTPKSQCSAEIDFTELSDPNVHHYEARINGGTYTDEIVRVYKPETRLYFPVPGTTYQVQLQSVKKIGNKSAFCAAVPVVIPPAPVGYTPNDAPDIKAWLTVPFQNVDLTNPATSDGQKVASVRDDAGDFNFTNTGDLITRPRLYNGIFGTLPALRFTSYDGDSTNQLLSNPTLGGQLRKNVTLVICFQQDVPNRNSNVSLFAWGDATGDTQRRWEVSEFLGNIRFRDGSTSQDGSYSEFVEGPVVADNTPKLLTLIIDGFTVTLRVNAVTVAQKDIYMFNYTSTAAHFGDAAISFMTPPVCVGSALKGADLSDLEQKVATAAGISI